MLNKLKYNIKKAFNLKSLTIKVLITSPQGESYQTEIDTLPEHDESIFIIDPLLSGRYGRPMYVFFDCTNFTKIEDVYHCKSEITGTWLIRILP